MNSVRNLGLSRRHRFAGLALMLLSAVLTWAQRPLAPDFLLPKSIQAGMLTPGQPRTEASFPVDSTATRIHLDVRATVADLEVTLEAPDGRMVTVQSAAGMGGEYAYFYFDSDVSLFGMMTLWSRGHHYAYKLPALGEGVYTVRVSSPAAVTEPVALVFEFGANSTRVSRSASVRTSLRIDGPDMAALLDLPNRLVVSAQDDTTPVTGSVVRVEVGPEDGAREDIILLDDGQGADLQAGDGLYSGWFTPRVAGQYRATAHIQLPARYGDDPAPAGSPAGGVTSWGRLEFAYFSVVRQGAKLTGRVTDRGLDEDGDKRFEKIVFDVEVEVEDAGEYWVTVTVAEQGSPDGIGSGGHQFVQLTPGLHAVSVPVDVDALHESGHASPYEIRSVRLDNRNEPGKPTVSTLENAGVTRAYSAAELQKPRIALAGAISDRGVDEDGDGLFDWLVVSVPVEVRKSYGNCSWEAQLITASGNSIDKAFGSGRFQFEQSVAELKFDGKRIRSSGVSGPYGVRGFQMTCIVHDFDTYDLGKTQAYSASQFGGVRGSITEISHRAVRRGESVYVGVEASRTSFQQSGSAVTISPPLDTSAVTVTEPTYLRFHLTVGDDAPLGPRSITVTTGNEVVRLENAFSVIDAPAEPPEVVEEETTARESAPQPPLDLYAKLTGRVQERLIDEDRDGLAEALALDVEVAVAKPGDYHVTARLSPSDGVLPSSRVTELSPGPQWLPIIIRDALLYRFGESFQFTMDSVTLTVKHDSGAAQISKIENLEPTRRYEMSQFRPPRSALAGEPSEEAVDDNGDGLFDRLVVTVPVEKRREGRYPGDRWGGRLEGSSGKQIGYATQSGPLPVGMNLLRLEFDGAKIRVANIDGPYIVREFGASGFGVPVDKLMETRSYRADQFRGLPRLLLIKPKMAHQGETVTVEIRGSATSFSGESLVNAGESITVEPEIVPGPEFLRATFRIDPQAELGQRTVTVTTGGETASLPQAFRVLRPGETGSEPLPRKPPPKGKISGELRDRAVDDDGNGRFERFVIDVDAELEEPGEYTVVLYLQHSDGQTESLSSSREVAAGKQTFSVSFPADRLHAMPKQTPYTVQQIVLRAGSARDRAHMDRFRTNWKTKQYDVADFEPARLVVSEAREKAFDDDGDGLHDRLVVTVPVEVRGEAGSEVSYSWALGLRDEAGGYIYVVRDEGPLGPGLNQIEVSFPGERIRSYGANGPYRLGTFLLKSAEGSVLIDSVGTTGEYAAEKFEVTGAARPRR